MLKTIRNIIILCLVLIILGLIPYILSVGEFNKVNKISKDTNIIVNDYGKIEITERVIFKSGKNGNIYVQIPYVFEVENNWIKPTNITVKLNDDILQENNSNTDETSFMNSTTTLTVKNIKAIKNNEYIVDINYEYNATNIIEEYKNLSVLKLSTGDNVYKSNIKIKLPQKTNKFELNSNAQIEYLGNNTYNINGVLRIPYAELIIDKGIITNVKSINEDYEITSFNNSLKMEDDEILKTIIVLMIISTISLIIISILTRKVKCEKNYVRETDGIMEPILAEAIIDKKIGAKELIMSCIVELIYRGNLKNIGNNKVQFLTDDKTSEYEKEILGLIFTHPNQIVTFDDIKKIFVVDNKETKAFLKKFKKIAQKIENKLFDYNVYSKVGEKILKIFKIISIDIIMICLYVLIVSVIFQEMLIIKNLITFIIIATIISIIIGKSNASLIESILNISIFNLVSFPIFVGFIAGAIYLNLGLFIFIQMYNHLDVILLISIVIMINMIIMYKSKTHIFTSVGKMEFAKIYGLKQYMIDYSLMKERELESVIIWDEYLAYAVAFGIPNKITDKFSENLMNTNIVLQKLENILKM